MMVDVVGILTAALVILAATVYYWFLFQRKVPDNKGRHETIKSVAAPTAAGAAARTEQKENVVDQSTSKKKNKQQQQQQQQHNKTTKKSTSSTVDTTKKVPTHPRWVRRFGGHSDIVIAMSISPNGEWMATAGKDGLLRVASVDKSNTFQVQCKIAAAAAAAAAIGQQSEDGIYQPTLQALAWQGDNRTLIGSLHLSRELVFFRIRPKPTTTKGEHHITTKNPYELVQLVKRTIHASSSKFQEGEQVDTVLVDASHLNYTLIVTSSQEVDHGRPNVVAWHGETGTVLGTLTVPGGKVRMSYNGRFLAGRIQGTAHQVKLYEIVCKKLKGESDPMVEKIATKSCMTLISNSTTPTTTNNKNNNNKGGGTKIVDVDFMKLESSDNNYNNKAVVACVDGTLQVWDLDVEYKQGADPKVICTCDALVGKSSSSSSIVLLAASGVHSDRCIAVVTKDASLHIFSYTAATTTTILPAKLTLCLTIPNTHSDGVGDIQWCPHPAASSPRFVYTRGAYSKDVYCWNVE
jgi:WD40 repeat protein